MPKRTSEEACIEYAIAAGHVRMLTVLLGNSPCTFDDSQTNECLSLYWITRGQDDNGVALPDPQIEYDDMCEACKSRERAIRERRDARKRLGAAKRSVEAVGKRLNAEAVRG
jgi:hypothetical protein